MLLSLLFHNITDQKKNKKNNRNDSWTLFFLTLLNISSNTSWNWNWVVLLCDISKKTAGTSRTQGGTRWSKKHSTLYFPGTGKRHGLVVSGMALGEFRGNTEGYIVWISISLHRNTFNFSQLEWNSPGAADAFAGKLTRQHMSHVWCLKKRISPTPDQNT